MMSEKYSFSAIFMVILEEKTYSCTVVIYKRNLRRQEYFLIYSARYDRTSTFNYSRFGNQKSKESTARIVLFKTLQIPNVFTCESSFCGNEHGPFKDKHFTREDLRQVGKDICRSILIYSGIKIPDDVDLPFEM